MLAELYIRNFAIIDELRMRLAPGFNVLTGETGAGKSIILDAVLLVLGGRADSTVVRAGSEEAYVEAVFQLGPAQQRQVEPILRDEGLDDESGEFIVLARELRSNGRSISRVNGRAVSVSVLRDITGSLIDIHGQGDHLSLLKPRSHLPLLDAFAGLEGEREALAAEVAAYQRVRRELQLLQRDKHDLAQRIELLGYKAEEIAAAGLRPGEEEELRTERTRLANAEQLGRLAREAVAVLSGVDDDTPAAAMMLGKAEHALGQLARLDGSHQATLETLQGLSYQLNELAGEIQDYLDALEYNPQRLNSVEERLELIASLKRKYATDSVTSLIEAGERAAADLKALQNSEVRTAELEAEQERYLRAIGRLAQGLSSRRQAAAERLASAVESHLTDLKMDGARFGVDFTTEPSPEGARVEVDGREERLAFDSSGIDRVEFVMSANPGEPLRPLAKVASGGETARLMLALKTALAQVDETPTLIFDEIDQGIGGRVGDIVGRKLWGLAAETHHQVIVVTHLPQLAGYGDMHFHVSKSVAGGRTTTAVQALDTSGRVRELGEMLGTHDDAARDGAESILRQVQQMKAATRAAA
jgi:DNA repair protein RecN (Recombination protein N)